MAIFFVIVMENGLSLDIPPYIFLCETSHSNHFQKETRMLPLSCFTFAYDSWQSGTNLHHHRGAAAVLALSREGFFVVLEYNILEGILHALKIAPQIIKGYSDSFSSWLIILLINNEVQRIS